MSIIRRFGPTNFYTFASAMIIITLYISDLSTPPESVTMANVLAYIVYGAHFSVALLCLICGWNVLSPSASDAMVDVTQFAASIEERAMKRKLGDVWACILLQVACIMALLAMDLLYSGLLALVSLFTFAVAQKVCYDQYQLYVLQYGEDAE